MCSQCQWWAERHTVVSTRELGPKLVQAGGKSGSEFRYPRHGRMRASICGRGSHRHGGVAATCGQRCVLSWDLGWDGETGAGTLGLHGRGGLGRPAASSAERARARGGRSNMRRCVHEPFTNVHERSRTHPDVGVRTRFRKRTKTNEHTNVCERGS